MFLFRLSVVCLFVCVAILSFAIVIPVYMVEGGEVLVLQMILGAAHALRGGAAVHVVHHRAATVVHGLLANSHLTNAVADLMTLGYWAFLQLA